MKEYFKDSEGRIVCVDEISGEVRTVKSILAELNALERSKQVLKDVIEFYKIKHNMPEVMAHEIQSERTN